MLADPRLKLCVSTGDRTIHGRECNLQQHRGLPLTTQSNMHIGRDAQIKELRDLVGRLCSGHVGRLAEYDVQMITRAKARMMLSRIECNNPRDTQTAVVVVGVFDKRNHSQSAMGRHASDPVRTAHIPFGLGNDMRCERNRRVARSIDNCDHKCREPLPHSRDGAAEHNLVQLRLLPTALLLRLPRIRRPQRQEPIQIGARLHRRRVCRLVKDHNHAIAIAQRPLWVRRRCKHKLEMRQHRAFAAAPGSRDRNRRLAGRVAGQCCLSRADFCRCGESNREIERRHHIAVQMPERLRVSVGGSFGLGNTRAVVHTGNGDHQCARVDPLALGSGTDIVRKRQLLLKLCARANGLGHVGVDIKGQCDQIAI
eukprot:comp22430_c0_seq1/m.54942 comp22430_c0_seq1/g.54942  ORF comp22430_c0_seq1/g.54942 comp22430_c0_seq1/m.54942 type:complete len:368 (-) comp22430_c0_seq1:818-1921(-)